MKRTDPRQPSPHRRGGGAKKFEYRVLATGGRNKDDIQRALNEHGDAGWKLVPCYSDRYVYLRRVKQQDNDGETTQ